MNQIANLLGCRWGREISTAGHNRPCTSMAVQIVVLHGGDQGPLAVKLCGPHRDFVLAETNAHSAASDVSATTDGEVA